MAKETIILNGVAYSAKDVQVLFLGRIVVGVTEISWSEATEIEKTHVVGTANPVARTRGKNDAKGSMTILMNELAGIEIAAGDSISKLEPFDVQVIFKALPIPLKTVLKGAMVTDKAVDVSAGSASAIAAKLSLDFSEVLEMQKL